MIEVDARVFRRGLRLVSGWKAFGDAENTDAISVPRHFLSHINDI